MLLKYCQVIGHNTFKLLMNFTSVLTVHMNKALHMSLTMNTFCFYQGKAKMSTSTIVRNLLDCNMCKWYSIC